MAEIERLTITLPTELTALVRGAVDEGNYASSSEVVRETLRDWKTKRALELHELGALKAGIDHGLAYVAMWPPAGLRSSTRSASLSAGGRCQPAASAPPDRGGGSRPGRNLSRSVLHGVRDVAALAERGGLA